MTDVHQPSGRYTVHLVVTQEGTGLLLYESRTDMLMAMLDSSRVPTGYTDAEGKLVLKDKKLFPHLYDLPDMTATDETGEIIGTLTLTATMRISLTDTLADRSMGFNEGNSGRHGCSAGMGSAAAEGRGSRSSPEESRSWPKDLPRWSSTWDWSIRTRSTDRRISRRSPRPGSSAGLPA